VLLSVAASRTIPTLLPAGTRLGIMACSTTCCGGLAGTRSVQSVRLALHFLLGDLAVRDWAALTAVRNLLSNNAIKLGITGQNYWHGSC